MEIKERDVMIGDLVNQYGNYCFISREDHFVKPYYLDGATAIILDKDILFRLGYNIVRSTNVECLTEYHRHSSMRQAEQRDPRMITYDSSRNLYSVWNELKPEFSLRMNYVHHLQQVLRLVGVELTLENE